MRIVIVFSFIIAGAQGKQKEGSVVECGVEASTNLIHHNPWLVYLEYHRRYRVMETRCAATLLDSRHLLTAAHCVKKFRFTSLVARLGEYDVTKDRDCVQGVCADPAVSIQIDDIIVHPDYDGSDHDVAVLRLKEPVVFTEFIRPICLPTSEEPLPPNAILAAAGWGEIPALGLYSDVKKIVPLPHRTKDVCRSAYQNSKIPEHIICAGGEEGIDTCRGDSGGPLMFVGDKVEIVGVTSSGNFHCGTKDSPGMYTSIKDHLDWIKNVIKV